MRLLLACVVLSAAAQAATINTTITVTNATVTLGANIVISGPFTATNIGSGSFTGTIPTSSLTSGGSSASGNFTATLSNGTDSITGTATLPLILFTGGQSGTGSATITGGTGAYANATGSFPTVNYSVSGSLPSLTVSFTAMGTITTGGSGGGGGAAPTITGILNNYSFTPPGFPNSGIAQGALFIVQGTGMADPSAQAVLQSSASPGLPSTLNGASAKVTVNGTTTTPVFYYAIATQLALVLPSGTPTGNGQITVTYNGQSASFPIQVVSSAMGFDAYYGTGAGLGVATDNTTGALFNYTNSIPPGTTIVLWGSGLGADASRDTTFVAPPTSINNLAHVYVGGVDAPIAYQGASGYPGVNQVDITIPTSVLTGCNVSVVGVTAAGVPPNFVTLPIGTGVCADQAFGITGTDYQNLTGQTTVKTGFVALAHSISPSSSGTGTEVNDIAIADFEKTTGSSYGGGNGGTVSIPGCTVTETLGTGTSTSTGLNAGNITVTGPNGNATLTAIPQVVGTYVAQLAAGFIPTSGGSFTFNGSGGADVGSFTTSVVFPNPLLTWTNQASDATVNRGSGVLFTWSGGTPGTLVIMNGNSSGTVSGQSVYASFTCIAPQSALQFQVPNYVTGILPPGTGSLSIANYTDYQTFTATGIDRGTSAGFTSTMINATYQ
jgi:uncharacterized protein (TIGR03437 family)